MSRPDRPETPTSPETVPDATPKPATPSPLSSRQSPAGKPLPPPDPAAKRTRPVAVSLAHVAARQEMRNLMKAMGLEQVIAPLDVAA